jgi:hypothetical protein
VRAFTSKKLISLMGKLSWPHQRESNTKTTVIFGNSFSNATQRELYGNYGVLEYWLIDLYRQQAFFWKNVNGIWEDLPVDKKGVVRPEVLPGFWLRVDWLFAAEELDELEILETILAGAPNGE